MRTFIENYLHFIKNCIRPPYKKLESLKSGFIENSNFENNRDPWLAVCAKQQQQQMWCAFCQNSKSRIVNPNQPNLLISRERKLPPRVKDPPSPGEIPLDVHGRQKTP